MLHITTSGVFPESEGTDTKQEYKSCYVYINKKCSENPSSKTRLPTEMMEYIRKSIVLVLRKKMQYCVWTSTLQEFTQPSDSVIFWHTGFFWMLP